MIPFKQNSLILAPMAGVTDSGFRKICKKYGADITVSEMVSSKGLYYNDKKSIELLNYSLDETPIIIQIFGHEPECLKKAAEFVTANYNPIAIDINMGCPAPKIFGNGDGCALMLNLDLAYSLIDAVKQNTNLPVSVKFRSGVNENCINAVEFAKMCENAKADYITVHGRTREQFYSGKSDSEIIKQVIENVSIPVVANGDILTCDDVLKFKNMGAHSFMIGRGALGNPQIFNKIKSNQTNADAFDIAQEHLEFMLQSKPELIAVKEFRKHLLWYFKGVRNAAEYKRKASSVNTYSECLKLLKLAKEQSDSI